MQPSLRAWWSVKSVAGHSLSGLGTGLAWGSSMLPLSPTRNIALPLPSSACRLVENTPGQSSETLRRVDRFQRVPCVVGVRCDGHIGGMPHLHGYGLVS